MSSAQGIGAPGQDDPDAPITVSLYEKWKKIHPLWVSGGFQTWRRVLLVILIAVYYIGPWLRWDGNPGFRFDLLHRQFTVFWFRFVPEDFVLLAWFLLIAALTLFTVTVAAGRIFCGWACPQTVWSLVYFSIERFVEGDRNVRMRLDRGPWNSNRIIKKTIKFSLWAAVAFSISITFIGYFQPIEALLPKIARLELNQWEKFFLLFPAAGSFFLSGVLREQVCFHMCPYARFQSVMFDRDSLIISYDTDRGEPRGSRKRSADPAKAGIGSCIDCRKCVSVCPTGIDIRDGLQYQCIGCAACVDACTDVMQTMGYGDSLVRYSSENRDQGGESHLIRPRLVGYSTLIVALIAALIYTVTFRIPLDLDITRDRNRLFREAWDGSIENVYTLRIANLDSVDQEYEIDFTSDRPLEYRGEDTVTIRSGETKPVVVSMFRMGDPDNPDRVWAEPAATFVEFEIRSKLNQDVSVKESTPFHAPVRNENEGEARP